MQTAAKVHDEVCRHLLEHRCTSGAQLREAVSLLLQMEAEGVPCKVQAKPAQAFVQAEVGLCDRHMSLPVTLSCKHDEVFVSWTCTVYASCLRLNSKMASTVSTRAACKCCRSSRPIRGAA